MAKFPTNATVIDNFNRADGPGGGQPPTGWSTNGYADGSAFTCGITIQSNAAKDASTGGYWNTTFGPDCEVYITNPTNSTWANNSNWQLQARMQQINTATPDGYRVQFGRRNIINGFLVVIGRIDNKVITNLTPTGEITGGQAADGNKYGFACYGSRLTAYIWRSATGWTMAGQAIDATYTAAGYIGYVNNNASAFVFDDFSGGTATGPYNYDWRVFFPAFPESVALTDSVTPVKAKAAVNYKKFLASYSGVVRADAPLSYWRLGEPNGSSFAGDEMGLHSGTYIFSPTLGVASLLSGDGNTAMSCQGAGSQAGMYLPANETEYQLGTGTIEAWVKTTDTGTAKSIIVKQFAYAMFAWSGNLYGYDWNAGPLDSGVFIADGLRHHVVMTFQAGGAMKLYCDGVPLTTRSGFSINAQSAYLSVGFNPAAGQDLIGVIDEAAIYNYVLTPAQILSHYQIGTAPTGDGVALTDSISRSRNVKRFLASYRDVILSDAPVSYYRLGEASGTTINDSSGHGNHAVVSGSPVMGVTPGIADSDKAIQFDGVDDYITIPNSQVIPAGSNITLEWWQYVATAQVKTNVAISLAGGLCQSHAPWSDQYLYWDYDDGTYAGRVATSYTAYLDKWTHICLTFDSATNKHAISFNGVEVANVISPSKPAANLVGGLISHPSSPHNATVDEVAIYSYALTPAQILNHYRVGLSALDSDGVALSDSISRKRNTKRTTADVITLTDTPARTMAKRRTFADVITLADARVRTMAKKRTFADAIALTDARTRIMAKKRTIADALALVDARKKSVGKKISDLLAFVDFGTITWTANRPANDRVNLADQITPAETGPANTLITLAATTTLVPTLARVQKDSRVLSVTTPLTPSLSKLLKLLKTQPVTVTLTPVITRQAKFARTVSASVTLAPVLIRKLLAYRTVAALATITPVMNKFVAGARTFPVSMSLTPVLARKFQRFITLAAGGGGSTIEDFNRADAANLGANWTTMAAFGNPVPIANNKANIVSGNRAQVWNPNTLGADQEVSLTVTDMTYNGAHVWLFLQVANPADVNFTGYLFDIIEGFSTYDVILYRGNSGSYTNLGSSSGIPFGHPGTFGIGDVWTLRKTGAVITVLLNGVAVAGFPITDPAPLNATSYVGLGGNGTAGTSVDDFTIGSAAGSVFTAALSYFKTSAPTGNNTPVTIAVNVILTPALVRGQKLSQSLAASTTLAPAMSRLVKSYRVVSGSVILTPALVRKLSAQRVFAASTVITPLLTKFSGPSRVFNAGLNLAPALSRRLSAYRTFAASTTLTPTLTPRIAAGRLLAASTAILASMTNPVRKLRSVTGAVVLTPSLSFLSGKGRVLNATVSLVVGMKRTIGKGFPVNLNFIPKIQRKSTMTLAAQVTLNPALSLRSRFLRVFDMVITLSALLSKATGKRISLAAQVPLTANMLFGRVWKVSLSVAANFTALLDYLYTHARKPIEVLFGSRPSDAQLLAVSVAEETTLHAASLDSEISTLLSAGNGEIPELEGAGTEVPGLRSVT